MRSINRIMVSLVVAGMSISFVACSQTKKEESSHGDHQHKAAPNKKADVSVEQSQNILTAYLEIKEALVKTNGDQASAAAAKLVKVLGDVQGKLITEIGNDAKQIAATNTAKLQRNFFNGLSNNIYTLIKSTQANKAVIYRQHCPMAMNSKGAYWLSTEKEVNNPYFGDMMLHCGSVKETLATSE